MSVNNPLSVKLKDPSLLISDGFIGGDWTSKSSSGKTFEVTNPSTGSVIATLPDMGVKETQISIDAA